MKRVLLGLTLVTSMMCSVGCHNLRNKNCNSCNGATGCRPCNLGWQRGGSDYQRYLSSNQGHHAPPTAAAGGQVAYPYYTNRGPRDFLVDNPPTIGR